MSEYEHEQPEPTPEPDAPPEPEEPTPGGPDAPAPALDYGQMFSAPEFQQAIGQAIYSTLGQMSEGGEGGEEAESELDLYGDPNELRENITGLIQREIQQAMQPILPAVEQMEVANWQDKIDQQIASLETVKQIDQFLPAETPDDQRAPVLVERMATAFLPEMRQLYGDSDRALEASLRAAADYILPVAKQMHAAGYGARNAELQRLSGAPAPAPAQGGPAEILDEPSNELEAAARYADRHGLR